MKTQSVSNHRVSRTFVVSAVSVLVMAGIGLARASSPAVALVDDAMISAIVQDNCRGAGLDVKLFVHSAGRAPALDLERTSTCQTEQKETRTKATAAVTPSLDPVQSVSPSPLQEKS